MGAGCPVFPFVSHLLCLLKAVSNGMWPMTFFERLMFWEMGVIPPFLRLVGLGLALVRERRAR